MVKKNPPLTPSPEFDGNREIKVILESIHGDVRTIAEGHSLLNEKFDKLSLKVDRIESDLSFVKIDIRFLKEGQKRLEDDVDKLKCGQERLEAKFDSFSEAIDKRVTKLEAAAK